MNWALAPADPSFAEFAFHADFFRSLSRAVSIHMLTPEDRTRWHFLEENATWPQAFRKEKNRNRFSGRLLLTCSTCGPHVLIVTAHSWPSSQKYPGGIASIHRHELNQGDSLSQCPARASAPVSCCPRPMHRCPLLLC